MKFALSILITFICCFQLKAQSDEHIQKRSRGYMENRLHKVTVRSLNVKRAIPLTFALSAAHLVIIDDKIYKGTDPFLKRIDPDSLDFLDNVRDSTSKSGIKHIVFYRTKAKTNR